MKRDKAPAKNEKTPSIQTSADRKASKRFSSGDETQLATSYEDMLALDFRDPVKSSKENKSPVTKSRQTAEKLSKVDQTAASRGPLQNIDNLQSTKKSEKNSNCSSTKTFSSANQSKTPPCEKPNPESDMVDKACMTELTAEEIDLKFKDFAAFAELFKVVDAKPVARSSEPGAGGVVTAGTDKQRDESVELRGEVKKNKGGR